MRILFLSNYYPPVAPGGYERLCESVADGLKRRGHDIIVLTNNHPSKSTVVHEYPVLRVLNPVIDSRPWRATAQFFFARKKQEEINHQRFYHLVQQFQPEIIFVWGMWNIHRSLLSLGEKFEKVQSVYFFADYWPTLPNGYVLHFREPARHWYTQIPKWLLGRIALTILSAEPTPTALRFDHAICISGALREDLLGLGLLPNGATIINGGTDLNRFLIPVFDLEKKKERTPLALLSIGRLDPDKGVHTAIEALSVLRERGYDLSLTIVGSGDPQYLARLKQLALEKKLYNFVRFTGRLSDDAMLATMREHDVFVFPTRNDTFGLVILEAMASGLVVVGATPGGTREILFHEQNSLVCAPDDSRELALQIERLIVDPALCWKLREAGYQMVAHSFGIDNMVEKIELELFQSIR